MPNKIINTFLNKLNGQKNVIINYLKLFINISKSL